MPHVPDYQSKVDPPGTEITRYIRTWKEYRKRRWVAFGVLGLFPLIVMGMIALEVAGAGPLRQGALVFRLGDRRWCDGLVAQQHPLPTLRPTLFPPSGVCHRGEMSVLQATEVGDV